MTPAEELRAAAERLRELAAKATPGPWAEPYYDATQGDQGWWVHNGQEGTREHAVMVTFWLNPNAAADARWITAASPAIAPYLRSWLLFAAGMYDLGPRGQSEAVANLRVSQADRSALAFARLILPAAPTPSSTGSNLGGEA